MSQHEVIVVGAGIVGMATALSLQREGHKVTVLDSGAPGSGASMGNAGCICPASCVPESGPGVMMQAPGWLADPLGPLALRWRYLPKFLPWLIRFIRAGQPDRVEAQSQALRALYRSAYDAYTPLLQFAGASGLFQKIGYVIAYETEAAWNKDRGSFAMRARRGVQMTELDDAGMRALEPALNPAFKRGVQLTENGYCTDPLLLVQRFAEAFTNAGGVIKQEKVSDCAADANAVTVVTDHGVQRAERLVVAAGARSHFLASQLGSKVPLETERGYHAQLADPGVSPSLPVMSGEHKFIATPMRLGLRFAGTVEFAGLEAAPNWGRAEKLMELGKRMYPDLDTSKPSFWMGHRPSLPDSLPVISKSPHHRSVFYAFGHAHLGLTGAAVTGQIIADLVAGRTPAIDPSPYAVDRF